MEFGMSTASLFGRMTTEQALSKIGEMNIPCAEIFLSTFQEYQTDFARLLYDIAQEFHIHITSVHPFSLGFEPQLFSSYARSRQDAFQIYQQVLQSAQILHADKYVMHGLANVKHIDPKTLDVTKMAQYLDMAADMAADYGVKLTYENVHWCFFAFPEFAQRLLDAVRSTNLYFTLDIKQAAQSHYFYQEYFPYMAAHLANVHLCDYHIKGQTVQTLLPFQGDVDFNELFSLLRQSGFDGSMMLEVYASDYHGIDELLQNYHRLQQTIALYWN